jgi:hypothetical protein
VFAMKKSNSFQEVLIRKLKFGVKIPSNVSKLWKDILVIYTLPILEVMDSK